MQGLELHEWRKRQGWTLDQAARYLGTTKTSVHRWEAGVYPVPHTIVILTHLLSAERNKRSVEDFCWK